MQQRSAKPGSSHTPLVRVISWISSIGVLSSGMVWAQSQTVSDPVTDPSVYETPSAPEPAPAAAAPEPAPAVEIPASVAPQPAPVVEIPKPASAVEIPASVAPQPIPAAVMPAPVPMESYTPPASALPSLGTSPAALPTPIAPPEVSPIPLPSTAQNQGPDYSNVYIDPTSYSIGATTTYEEPSSVVLSERSTGCETVLGSGQSPSGQACGLSPDSASVPSLIPGANGSAGLPGFDPNNIPPLSVPYAPQQLPPPVVVSEGTQPYTGAVAPPYANSGTLQPSVTPAQPGQRWVAPQRIPQYQAPQRPTNAMPLSVPAQPAGFAQAEPPVVESPPMVSVGPVNIGSNGISLGTSQPDSTQSYYNPLIRPIGLPGNGNTSLLFPLSIPSPITSAFGWRVHPISGSSQLHSGTDLAADMGTPVLAALDGAVTVSDYLGGYGLTVVLEHSQGTQETLYAHLSQVFVKPGTQIKQGEVIGLVGSTGYSTGPHLHFELRQLTANGWITMDPGDQLEYALARLVKVLETAQTNPKASQPARQKAG